MKLSLEKNLILIVFLMLAMIFAVRAFVWMQQFQVENAGFSTEKMVEGTAVKPFAYRILVPQATGLIYNDLSASQRLALASTGRLLRDNFLVLIGQPVGDPKSPVKFLCLRFISATLTALFLFGYGLALYQLAALFFASPVTCFIAPIIGYAMIPTGIWQASFMYDPATLCLSAWCLYTLFIHRWLSFLMLFILACLNKETALYITMIYVVCEYQNLKKLPFIALLLLQLAVYVVIVGSIHMAYAGNAGGDVESHWREYAQDWLAVASYEKPAIMLFGLFLLVYRLPEKPEKLRRSLWVVAIATLVWMNFGRSAELRALYDIYPIIALLLTHTLAHAMGLEPARAPPFKRQVL